MAARPIVSYNTPVTTSESARSFFFFAASTGVFLRRVVLPAPLQKRTWGTDGACSQVQALYLFGWANPVRQPRVRLSIIAVPLLVFVYINRDRVN